MFFLRNTVLVLLLCATSLYARGSDDSCGYDSEPYHSVAMDVPCTLELVKSDTQDIELYGDRKVLKDLEISCKKGTVYLRSKDRGWTLRSRDDELRIVLYSPVLEEISCSSSGRIVSMDAWEGDELRISNRNSADIELKTFSYETIFLESRGSGDIRLGELASEGKLHIKTEGSGDIHIHSLNSERVDISSKGSGDLDLESLTCRKDLRLESRGSGRMNLDGMETPLFFLRSNGSGDINLGGHAGNTDISVGGSGDVNAENLISDRLKVRESGSGSVYGN